MAPDKNEQISRKSSDENRLVVVVCQHDGVSCVWGEPVLRPYLHLDPQIGFHFDPLSRLGRFRSSNFGDLLFHVGTSLCPSPLVLRGQLTRLQQQHPTSNPGGILPPVAPVRPG